MSDRLDELFLNPPGGKVALDQTKLLDAAYQQFVAAEDAFEIID